MLEVLARIRHRRTRRQLSPYLDGMLSVQESRRLQAHLAQCQACRDELAELQATVQSLAELPLVESPRSFALTAAPRRAEAPRPAARRVEFGLRLATATAAFALAVVAVGDLLEGPGGDDRQDAEANVARMEAVHSEAGPLTAEAQMAEVTAEDKAATEAPTLSAPAPGAVGPEIESPPAGMGSGEEETPPSETPAPNPSAPPGAAAPGITEPATGGATPAATATLAATPSPAANAVPETPALTETPAPAETPLAAFGLGGTPEVVAPTAAPETPAATATPPSVSANISPSETEEQTPSGAENQALAEADRQSLAVDEGGPSRETVLRWLEIGLATGLALLFVSWVLARRRGRA